MTRTWIWMVVCFAMGACGPGPAPDTHDGGVDAASTSDAATDAGAMPDVGTDTSTPVDGGPCAPPHTPTSCHTQADCNGAELCVGPGRMLCGECVPSMATCTSSADCAPTDACVTFDVPCSCDGTPSTECRPRCSAGSCAEGETCEPTSGLCLPTSCMAGYACPPHTMCDPRPAADPHGCNRHPCIVDGDCDCGGACVDGYCWETLGVCTLPPP